MPRSRAHHAFGRTGGAGCIQDIGRVIAFYRNTFGRLNTCLKPMPVVIAAILEFGNLLFALENHTKFGLMGGQFNRAIQQRLIVDHAVRL